ncbi:MAG: hypothetical protein B7Z72_12765, partial [Gemmatimonadetes bacterium 21-71-4]
MAREPVPGADEPVLEDDGDVFEVGIDERGAGEAERHAHHLPRPAIQVHGADDARLGGVLGADLHLVDVEGLARDGDAQRIGDGVVVEPWAVLGQRVRGVAHLVAFPDADDVGEVVLDDPEVIAVVVDVGGQEQRVAA